MLTVFRYRENTFLADEENRWSVYSVCFSGDYETLLNDLRKDDVVLDLGANIGCFSILAARKAKFVYAVEPQVSAYSILVANILRNRTENVLPLNVAVGDHEGTSFLDGKGLEAHLSGYGDPVSLTTIDTIAQGKVDAIKMDIEGSEMDALSGATLSLKNARVVLLECHGTIREVSKLLTAEGFNQARYKPGGIAKVRNALSLDFVYDEVVGGFPGLISRLKFLRTDARTKRQTESEHFQIVIGHKPGLGRN